MNQIHTHLPGISDDEFMHYWNSWWVRQAFTNGQSPFYTRYLFYPLGVSLVTHNIAWFNVLPWLLLEPIVGGVEAYNLALLLNLTLCGYALFWLAQELSGDSRAAFLAGVIYQTWPFRLTQLDHPNLLSTLWVPVFFLFLIRTIREGRWRDTLLAGLFFALVGYTRWQQLIPVTLTGLVYFACAAPHWLPKNKHHILLRLIVAGCVAVTLLMPAVLLLASQTDNGSNLMHKDEETIMQTDVLAYVTPSGSHPLLGKYTGPLYDRYYHDRSGGRRVTAYIGLVPLLLALAGALVKRRSSLPWGLMAIILVLLALGPLLRINGQFYPQIPTLYGLLSPIGIIRLMREPDRFNVFLALPVSVLAAYGMQAVLSRIRWTRTFVIILLSGLILLEYLAIPAHLTPMPRFPSFYTQLAKEPGDFAVLNLPFGPLKAKRYMFAQIVHGRPIVQGKIARIPDSAYDYIGENLWLRGLRRTHEIPPELTDVSRQLQALAQDDIRYVIINKTVVGDDRVAHWKRYLLARPRYEDEQIAAYTTSPQAGRDFDLLEELAPGLGPIDLIVSADCVNPGRILEIDVGWGSKHTLNRDLDVTISLMDSEGATRQSERFPVSTRWPTSNWPSDAMAWGLYPFSLSPSLPTGSYTVVLGLLDAQTERPYGSPKPVQSIAVQSQICNLANRTEATDTNALFGDDLYLIEYKVRQQNRHLEVTLYWRAQRHMSIDYNIFVHVFDLTTDQPIAQDDAMPHRWAYPTTFWWPGEIVDDRIPISLEGVPPGSYGIAVGVYDPATGERLPLVNDQGHLIADRRLVLEETVKVK